MGSIRQSGIGWIGCLMDLMAVLSWMTQACIVTRPLTVVRDFLHISTGCHYSLMHLWLLFALFSSRLQRNNYNTLGVWVNTEHLKMSHVAGSCLCFRTIHIILPKQHLVSLCLGIINVFFLLHIWFWKKKAPQGACFENQSAAAAGCDLTRTKQNVLFPLCLGILCNPCSVQFGAIPSLPELHFDALHQPYDKSIAGAEANITSVISVFQFHWLWAS